MMMTRWSRWRSSSEATTSSLATLSLARRNLARHSATAYGYTDAIWSKYGKTIDGKATPPPVANPYNSAERPQLAGLAKRGVQFMVCGTASRGLAGRIAGPGGDAEAVLKDMTANLIPNARLVSAGVVGVTHAQEYGFTYLYVG